MIRAVILMKNSEYWKHRFELIEDATHKDSLQLYDDLQTQYIKAQKEIENQIRSWYQRFANNNQITMAEARRLLSTKELLELQWDVKEYIKYGEENAVDAIWMKQLENASAKYHISRLEALKLQTQQTIEVLFGNQLDQVDSLMKSIYTNGYYHSIYEIQKGFNVGWSVTAVDKRKLEKIILKPWSADGKTFSQNIWGRKNELINEVHTQLTQTVMLGKSPDDAIKAIAKKFGNGSKDKGMLYNAGRLVMTESAYFSSAAQEDCFNELDVEKFEIVATLDSLTSKICQGLDGHVEDMVNYEPGVTAPPFHVWCRSTTVPYFDDEFNIAERAARGKDGKTYYVPSNMKYPDWKESLVHGKTDRLQEIDPSDIMKDKQKDEWIGLEYTSSYTKQEAINHLQSEYGIQFTDSKKYPMNGELLGDCVSWMDSFSKQYPAFMKNNPCKIPTIVNQAPSKMKNAVGYYSYYSNGRVVELALNGKYHSDVKFFEEYVKNCVSIKWYPENSTIHKTFVHEFGHHVSNSMKTMLSKPNWENDFITACISDFKKQVPEYQYSSYVGMSDYVSRYGASSQSELFAEAFAEYFGGEKPRLFAKIFGEKLETLLKGVK